MRQGKSVFQKKSRALKPKVMSVKEAVEKFVHDGDYSLPAVSARTGSPRRLSMKF